MSNDLMNLPNFLNFDEETAKEITNLGKQLFDDYWKNLETFRQCNLSTRNYKTEEQVTEVNQNGIYELKIKAEGFLPEDIEIIVDRDLRTVTFHAKHEESVDEENGSSYSSSATTIMRIIPESVDIYSLSKTVENGIVTIKGHDLEEDNHTENIIKL